MVVISWPSPAYWATSFFGPWVLVALPTSIWVKIWYLKVPQVLIVAYGFPCFPWTLPLVWHHPFWILLEQIHLLMSSWKTDPFGYLPWYSHDMLKKVVGWILFLVASFDRSQLGFHVVPGSRAACVTVAGGSHAGSVVAGAFGCVQGQGHHHHTKGPRCAKPEPDFIGFSFTTGGVINYVELTANWVYARGNPTPPRLTISCSAWTSEGGAHWVDP